MKLFWDRPGNGAAWANYSSCPVEDAEAWMDHHAKRTAAIEEDIETQMAIIRAECASEAGARKFVYEHIADPAGFVEEIIRIACLNGDDSAETGHMVWRWVRNEMMKVAEAESE